MEVYSLPLDYFHVEQSISRSTWKPPSAMGRLRAIPTPIIGYSWRVSSQSQTKKAV